MAKLADSKPILLSSNWAVLLIFLGLVTAIHAVLIAMIKISLPEADESVQQERLINVDWIDLIPTPNLPKTTQEKTLVTKVTELAKSTKKEPIQSSIDNKLSRTTITERPKPQNTIQPALKNPLPSTKTLSTQPIREKNVETVTRSAILKAKGAESKIRLNLETLQQQITQIGTEIRLNQQSAETSRIRYADQISSNHFVVTQYVADWQKKVERTGNQNYPKAGVKKNFSAHLILDVGINTDGSIYSIRISQSSGNPALDEAAKQIVKMSAPFPPLPLELSKELRVLVISKTWSFSDQSGLTAR